MNRKTIIQIILIVACFGGAGFVLYNGFKGDDAPPPASVVSNGVGTMPEGEKILPYGDNLSGELKRVFSRNGLQPPPLDFPKLNPTEVGIPVVDLVKPLPVKE